MTSTARPLPAPTLHQALAIAGYTSEPAKGAKQYARRILRGRQVIGVMTANEAWAFLRTALRADAAPRFVASGEPMKAQFVGWVDSDGMRCREEDATHQLVTVPGPRGGQTEMRERHPSCQPRQR